jgi:hypothetical protein
MTEQEPLRHKLGMSAGFAQQYSRDRVVGSSFTQILDGDVITAGVVVNWIDGEDGTVTLVIEQRAVAVRGQCTTTCTRQHYANTFRGNSSGHLPPPVVRDGQHVDGQHDPGRQHRQTHAQQHTDQRKDHRTSPPITETRKTTGKEQT